jgi:hypothetical protein
VKNTFLLVLSLSGLCFLSACGGGGGAAAPPAPPPPVTVSNPPPSTVEFQATGDMGTQRAAHTATLLPNGKVLIAGGFNNSGGLATAELFDPATGTFMATGTMTGARVSHTATLLNSGKVLLAGGDGLNTAELFDPSTGTFTATGAMTGVRTQHAATLLNNGGIGDRRNRYRWTDTRDCRAFRSSNGVFFTDWHPHLSPRFSHRHFTQ